MQSVPPLALVPGPTWSSFEQFRRGGQSVLEEIPGSSLSHSDSAIRAVESFSSLLTGTKERLAIRNGDNAIIRPTVESGEVVGLGFDKPDDQFALL